MQKTITAVAIDDEPMAIKVIENFCAEIPAIRLDKSFADPQEGLKYLNKFPADLLFLDIDMPNMSGLELYRQLKQDVMVIFITSKSEYAVEGFNLRAVDYLVKPFTFERFGEAVARAGDFLRMSLQSAQGEENKYI